MNIKVNLMPNLHPHAVEDGNDVTYGPLHCAFKHGSCQWCVDNGYAEVWAGQSKVSVSAWLDRSGLLTVTLPDLADECPDCCSGFTVRQVLIHGPHGVALAQIEGDESLTDSLAKAAQAIGPMLAEDVRNIDTD